MKCVQHKVTGTIQRVSNEGAEQLVDRAAYKYVEKSLWKAKRKPAPSGSAMKHSVDTIVELEK